VGALWRVRTTTLWCLLHIEMTHSLLAAAYGMERALLSRANLVF